MFIAALFTIVKAWKQPNVHQQVTHTVEYCLALKTETMPPAATRTQQEIVILGKQVTKRKVSTIRHH